MNDPIESIPHSDSSISETLDIVELGIERIQKNDPYAKYRKAAEWGLTNGLIRYKSQSEINYEMRSKPWLDVNQKIKQNEKLGNVDNDNDTSTDPS